jgi:phosphosulfolactate synthase
MVEENAAMPFDGPVPDPDFLCLPPRPPKPRQVGVTHVIDRGLPLTTLQSLLHLAGPHIDFVKFGWGTAYVSRQIRAKIVACQDAGVRACPGGTLLELAAAQGKVAEFARWVADLGMETIEVSEGTIELDRDVKRGLIKSLAADFCVLSEVGSKDPDVPVRSGDWVDHMVGDLEAGAAYVVAEGRESGTVGLYRPGGEVREPLVEAILAAVPPDRVIFEAPNRAQQAWLIRRVGTEVNLGNVSPDDILSVETLRRGLRTDTVRFLGTDKPAPAIPDG